MNIRYRQISKYLRRWYYYVPELCRWYGGFLDVTIKWIPRSYMNFMEYEKIIREIERKNRISGNFVVECSNGLSIEV